LTLPQPLLTIVGPTGSGKSALALFLAHSFDAEIINCDSLQIYRSFDIGTAKISAAERETVPHHLLDVLAATEVFTAGDFQRLARECARDIAARGRVPIVVGGTGFYLRAFLDGLAAMPSRDELLRDRLLAGEKRRAGSLHRILRRLDPTAAGRIHENDTPKIIRALEVRIAAGRPASDLYAEGLRPLQGFKVVQIGLQPPREELYAVLNRRCEQMLASGLVEEVQQLLQQYPENSKPFEALGYKQVVQHLRGHLTYSQALEDMRQKTRNYAKRQWTWFKKDNRVSWIPGFGHSPEVQQTALLTILNTAPKIKKFLRS
jgi:tRNA dimethylallyltransferase